jgi:hypothetical protein
VKFTEMFEPIPLNLPSYPIRIKEEGDTTYIFDEIRKKFLVLTPEEWVRQHVVQFLVREKNYPRSLIQLEGGLKLNSLQKRSDILIYNNSGNKIVLVECKAPSVKISQDTFDQIARYNFIHRVQWLLVSNGLQHFCCEIDFKKESYRFVEELPQYA